MGMDRVFGFLKINFVLIKLFIMNLFSPKGLPRWISYNPCRDNGNVVYGEIVELKIVEINFNYIITYESRLREGTRLQYPLSGSLFLKHAILKMLLRLMFNRRVYDISRKNIIGCYVLRDDAITTEDGDVETTIEKYYV